MSGPSVTWMQVPAPAPRGYLVNPYKQGDTMTESSDALRSLKPADEQIVELSMLCDFDDELAAQTTQASNRIRGLLTQIHPALERVLGPRLDHPAVLDLLQRYPSPEKLALPGEKNWQPSSRPPSGKTPCCRYHPSADTTNRHRSRYECCCRCYPTPDTPAHHAT